jgi:uncharacterized membrane protein required for colicin V production
VTWFDIVALVLIVVVAWLESIRGFGRALVDLVGGVIIIKLTPVVSAPAAQTVALLGTPDANKGLWFGLTFLLLAALIVLAARLIYNTTLLSLEYFDPIVGALFGAATGMIVAFAFLHSLQLGYGTGEPGKVLAASFMGQELLSLRSLHRVLDACYHLGD